MASLIKFSCPTCGTKLAVPVEFAGTADDCPKCGTLVASPGSPTEEAAIVLSVADSPAPEQVDEGVESAPELAAAVKKAEVIEPEPERSIEPSSSAIAQLDLLTKAAAAAVVSPRAVPCRPL